MAAPTAGTVKQDINNLGSLTLDQCSSLVRRAEAEVENLSNHLSQLKFAASRVSEAREAVIQLDAYRQRQKEGEAPEVLVPLTGALYVKGRLDCDDKVLVDIGAGYMIQKTYQDEKKDAMRILTFMSEQQARLEKIISDKVKQLQVLVATLNRSRDEAPSGASVARRQPASA
ncbi:prefoldin subunit 5, putative [Eimeria tenella]|nr:prefoldin subunit 5, putative [Eimeria tenella]CDJ38769.1 prefoldin subunit 5, putative [Eimeria tenella]|eukprot:XP_013229525.1 prefoldin subunit 5, putative [Eimeria tenella]